MAIICVTVRRVGLSTAYTSPVVQEARDPTVGRPVNNVFRRSTAGAVLLASEFISASVVALCVRLRLVCKLTLDNGIDETIDTCSTSIALHDDHISSVLVELDMR